MRRTFWLLAVCLSLVSCSTLGEFTVVQMSDPQLGFREDAGFDQGLELLRAAVRDINAIKPDVVIVTGDMVNSSTSIEQKEAYRDEVKSIKTGMLYELPGNHDVKYADSQSLSSYIQEHGYDCFNFNYKGVAFIGLNSNLIVYGDSLQRKKHMEYFEEALRKAGNKRYIFVFMHCPVVTGSLNEKDTYSNFPTELRRPFLDLCKQYGVEAIFAGHLHQCFDVDIEGVRMITCGPSGLPLGKGRSGFNRIDIKKKSYSVEYILL